MSTAAAEAAPALQAGASAKFLTFFLDSEEYGIEILKVHEIIGLMPITRVPRTPEYVMGVVNLRGKVIPVVDLRLKFGMEAIEPTELTCIIVVQARGLVFGLVVDRVSEVVDLIQENIEDAPTFGSGIDTDYIMGMGKSEDRVTILLDIDRVLSQGDIEKMSAGQNED
ncbi:MAG: chemotaxis protein CheW [Gemmatimonadetes bacterium]|nr:MAG: chemotaxis protein CheW [Gemmatimonadota bacterium]